jgi:two-component system phosphate regulon sensor histidine kinase PhoR
LVARDGDPFGAVIVLNDVTRLRKLEQLRREFVANVSHELRTPITSIRGFVETMIDSDTDPKQQKKFLEIISRQTDRLSALIEDLLTLSRIEEGQQLPRPEVEEVSLQPILQRVIDSCGPAAAASKINLKLVWPDEIKITVHPRYFEQALLNLVDNAIKYNPAGTTVEISGVIEGGELVVSVKDNGSGIAPEHLDRLFERFYRIDRSRSREMGGTGLGLAITKHIAILHRGRVSVDSEVGKGSCFCIHLPLSAD